MILICSPKPTTSHKVTEAFLVYLNDSSNYIDQLTVKKNSYYFLNLLIFPGFVFLRRMITSPYTVPDSLAAEAIPYLILRNYSLKTSLLT